MGIDGADHYQHPLANGPYQARFVCNSCGLGNNHAHGHADFRALAVRNKGSAYWRLSAIGNLSKPAISFADQEHVDG
jgi:hypothetical protein